MQESLFIQKEIAGEHALTEKLLEEIARRDSHLAEGFFRMLRFPIAKFLAGLLKILGVEQMKS